MTHEEKVNWMAVWCAKHGCKLELKGECGFGRPCVGIVEHDTFPDYGLECWKPEDAYHKHDCVAVLGRGEAAESQLYDWLKWFDDNGYTVSTSKAEPSEYKDLGAIGLILGKNLHVTMVKKSVEVSR